jgi:hypothetical protein
MWSTWKSLRLTQTTNIEQEHHGQRYERADRQLRYAVADALAWGAGRGIPRHGCLMAATLSCAYGAARPRQCLKMRNSAELWIARRLGDRSVASDWWRRCLT